MYRKYTYRFANSNEYEYAYMGRYGAAGEKRAPKAKVTPEQVAKQNQKNKENRIRRVIKANFYPGDLWTTLKYPKGTRKDLKEVKKDLNRFLGKMRYRYKKADKPLKFIYRIEIGKRGGLHVHFLVNRIEGTDVMISKCWPWYAHFTPIYEEGGYSQLASYIAKPPPEEQKENEDAADTCHYSTSRNLIRPKPECKIYTRRTVRKIIENGPQPSTDEYYIEQDSIEIGENAFTGMSYIRYTERRKKEIWSGGES